MLSSRRSQTVVASKLRGGPNEILKIVEERAPNGFEHLEDVIGADKLEQIANGYHQTAGFDPDILNNRASLSVR